MQDGKLYIFGETTVEREGQPAFERSGSERKNEKAGLRVHTNPEGLSEAQTKLFNTPLSKLCRTW